MTDSEKNLISKLRKQTRAKSQKCYNPLCNELAIRSHIQQAEGTIRCISPSGTVVQLEDLDRRFNKMPYAFKEKGINHKGGVLTFWGFCNKCDTTIFREIEQKDTNFYEYKTQLLYSYRGFLSEYNKQEYNCKWYESILNCNNLSKNIKEFYSNLNNKFNLSVKLGKKIKLLFEKDLSEGSCHFEFIYFKLPKIEVCTSTSYCLPIILSPQVIHDIENETITKPTISPILINLIPSETELNVILGCLSDKEIKGRLELNKIANLTQKEKIKFISDILIKHVETWFVSISLYNTWKQRKMNHEILNQITKYIPAEKKLSYIKFNMFQDVIK